MDDLHDLEDYRELPVIKQPTSTPTPKKEDDKEDYNKHHRDYHGDWECGCYNCIEEAPSPFSAEIK